MTRGLTPSGGQIPWYSLPGNHDVNIVDRTNTELQGIARLRRDVSVDAAKTIYGVVLGDARATERERNRIRDLRLEVIPTDQYRSSRL